MKYKAVLLVVEDINKSRYLFETVFSQKIVADYGEDIAFEGFSIHQRKHFENLLNIKVNYKSNNCELYFEDDNLEEISNKIKDNNLVFVHDIIEQPWKQKAIRFYDYDKNLIEVGESFEGMAYRLYKEEYPIEEVLKLSFLNEEDLNRIIKGKEKFS
jgi:superfamily I DNA and/or RNA helicase